MPKLLMRLLRVLNDDEEGLSAVVEDHLMMAALSVLYEKPPLSPLHSLHFLHSPRYTSPAHIQLS